MRIDLPYLMQDVDRHGNIRLYVRRKNVGKVRLKLPPGAPGFMAEYKVALDRLSAGKVAPASAQPRAGTLGWLVAEYEKSFQFTRLDQRQRRGRHLILEAALNEPPKPGSKYRFRDCPLAEFTAEHVRLIRNRKEAAPSVANHRVMYLRMALTWGCEERSEHVKRNVAADVKPLKYVKEGFHTWTREGRSPSSRRGIRWAARRGWRSPSCSTRA